MIKFIFIFGGACFLTLFATMAFPSLWDSVQIFSTNPSKAFLLLIILTWLGYKSI